MKQIFNPKQSKSRLVIVAGLFAFVGVAMIIRSLAAPNPNLQGDLNGDNKVTLSDLSILLSSYGKADDAADINNDGIVNISDLSIMLSNWGKTGTNPTPTPAPTPTPPSPPTTPPVTGAGCSATPSSGTAVNGSGIAAAVAGAKGGETFLVSGSGNLSISGKNFSSPVVIKAASRLGATLTTVQITNSSGITLEGFKFAPTNDSTRVKIANSNNIKILRNSFDHKDITVNQSTIVTSGSSSKVEIACNEFKDKNRGDTGGTKITGSYIKTQYDEDGLMTKELHVHHNYFKGINYYIQPDGKPAGDSDREAIAMGVATSQTIATNNLVEYNLFEDCDGENEVITVKTSKNTFRYNTFKNSYGSLSIRFGDATTVEGNYFYGTGSGAAYTDPNFQTGGIRTYGTNHVLKNNFMKDLTGDVDPVGGKGWRVPIMVDSGDTSGTTGDSHPTSRNITVTGNTVLNSAEGIHIGSTHYGNKPSGVTVNNNTVSGSKGALFRDMATGGTWSGNKAHNAGGSTAVTGTAKSAAEVQVLTSAPSVSQPSPLTPANVGPNSP